MGAALSLATTLVKVDRLQGGSSSSTQGKLVSLLFFCMALFHISGENPSTGHMHQHEHNLKRCRGSRDRRIALQARPSTE